jgi:hypothetical protein
LSLPEGSWQHWCPRVGCWGIRRGTYGLTSRFPTETAKILPRNCKLINHSKIAAFKETIAWDL